MSKRESVELRLLGQRIALKSSESDPGRVKAVVDLVASKIQKAEKRVPKGIASPHQVALLALLELAEEYLEAKRKITTYKGEIEERTTRLLNLIEREGSTSGVRAETGYSTEALQ